MNGMVNQAHLPARQSSIPLPLAIGALAVWLALTVGGRWLEAGGHQQSLAEAAGGGIGWSWALAAAFSAAVALFAARRHADGLEAPWPLKSLRLAAPPLLYALLMLLLAWAGGWPPRAVMLTVACNAALVALSEELMFRVVLLQGLLRRYAVWPAVLASSALFGVAHLAGGLAGGDVGGALWQAGAAFLQGVAYAAIRLRTHSVWPMTVVHGMWDFALVTATLAAAADGEGSILPVVALLAVLPLSLYGAYLLRRSQRGALRVDAAGAAGASPG